MCTIFRENTLPVIKTQMLQKCCYLWVPSSAAASSSRWLNVKGRTVHILQLNGDTTVKTISYRQIRGIYAVQITNVSVWSWVLRHCVLCACYSKNVQKDNFSPNMLTVQFHSSLKRTAGY
jgi:hypothetical protein